MKYKVAIGQLNSNEVVEENLAKIEAMTKEAAANGAKLIAFPENSEYIGTDYAGNAQDAPGMITEFFSRIAKENGIYVHSGSLTLKSESGKPYNTSLFYSPEGKLIGEYSKLHMFDISLDEGPSYKESDETEPGKEIVLLDTKLGKFGMAICYDMRFAEIFKLQAMNGAQVLFVPADFTLNTGKDHWEPILRTRAIENTCYVVAPGQIGIKPEFAAYGKSMVIDPWGNVIAKASDREEVIYAEIDTDYIKAIRRQVPSLQNIRSDIYQLTSAYIKTYTEE